MIEDLSLMAYLITATQARPLKLKLELPSWLSPSPKSTTISLPKLNQIVKLL
jgi:hypothetical protein